MTATYPVADSAAGTSDRPVLRSAYQRSAAAYWNNGKTLWAGPDAGAD